MPEKILFESEQSSSRSDVAAYLRTVADKLETGETLALESGTESIELDIPQTIEFEVKAEHEGPPDAGELSVEFELEWDVDQSESSLDIS